MRLNRQHILRGLGELAVIIVGVLIALQVESWRDDREARGREQVQLLALTADFGETKTRLERVITAQRGTLAAIDQFLLIASGHATQPPVDSMRVLFSTLFTFYRLEAVTGAYDALVSSGDLRLLRDTELRSELADFASVLGDGYEDARLADALHLELGQRAAQLIDVLAAQPAAMLGRFEYSGTPRPVDFRPLLRDSEFLGTLTFVGITEGTHLNYFLDLEARVERMIQILETGEAEPITTDRAF